MAEEPMSFGMIDQVVDRKGFSEISLKYINQRPEQLAEALVELCERDRAAQIAKHKMTAEEVRAQIVESLTLVLVYWGRARREEGKNDSVDYREIVVAFAGVMDAAKRAQDMFADIHRAQRDPAVEKVLDDG